MKFTPQTEEQLMEAELCPQGKYPFSVLEAKEKRSKSGKDMIELKLDVHGDDFDYHVYDYISPDFMAFKFRHFFYTVGLGANYETGTCEAFVLPGREGWCDVGVKKAQGGYPPKNTITDYLLDGKVTAPESPKPAESPPGPLAGDADDVPF